MARTLLLDGVDNDQRAFSFFIYFFRHILVVVRLLCPSHSLLKQKFNLIISNLPFVYRILQWVCHNNIIGLPTSFAVLA